MSELESGSREGWMETYTGRRFYPLDPCSEDVDIRDIAHSLAYQCRYGGHARKFYSVAEHCCLLADYVLWGLAGEHLANNIAAMIALMHDAAEAYFSDVVRPIKHRLPDLKQLEAKIEHVVFPVFDLPKQLPVWMKELDTRILVDERKQVMLTQRNEWVTDALQPLGVICQGWPPHTAETEFLARYERLRLI